MSASSALFPEFDSAITTSPAPIIPRSPWLASAGWTNCAGVPVETRVAAILRATWPLLPMPVTISRPDAAAHKSSAAPNPPSSASASCRRPSISARITRRPTARSCASAVCRPRLAASPERFAWASSIKRTVSRGPHSHAGGRTPGIPRGRGAAAPSMCEDVLLRPPLQVKQDARRKKVESGAGEVGAPFALQHHVELGAQRVQVQHVGRRILQLLIGERRRAPIRALLLLRQIDAEQILAQIAQTVPVGKGAREARGDLGAIDRAGHDAEIPIDHPQIETGEVEQLC